MSRMYNMWRSLSRALSRWSCIIKSC